MKVFNFFLIIIYLVENIEKIYPKKTPANWSYAFKIITSAKIYIFYCESEVSLYNKF